MYLKYLRRIREWYRNSTLVWLADIVILVLCGYWGTEFVNRSSNAGLFVGFVVLLLAWAAGFRLLERAGIITRARRNKFFE